MPAHILSQRTSPLPISSSHLDLHVEDAVCPIRPTSAAKSKILLIEKIPVQIIKKTASSAKAVRNAIGQPDRFFDIDSK
jgi:hypothetical protein